MTSANTATIEISHDDAKTILALMEEFFHRQELSEEEERVLMKLCHLGNFGRPVPKHGSGP